MSINNQHKPGYKHTPLGWMPEEWHIYELGQHITTFSGGTPSRAISIYYGGNIPWIKSGDLNKGRIKSVDEYLSNEGLKNSSAKIVEPGTLLLALYGATAGITAFTDIKAAINQAILAIEPINSTYDKYFLDNWFKNQKEQIIYTYCQGGQPNLSAELVKSLLVKTPSRSEQRKIASILSTWDEAISKTQQLIAQLQKRNKGLMQQLLTGKKRLKGFERDWNRLHIYDIAKEVSLKNRKDKQLTVLSCTKYDGLVPSLEYFGRRVFGSDTSTYKVVPLHHFAYATNHIEEGSIGYQSMFEEALISPMYTVFKTNEQVHDDYLFKLLKSYHYIHQYCKRMEGSIDRRGGLRWDEFSKIAIHLPELGEQVAIATLINKAVEEVKLYEQRLAALQQQKKGLMQKLLTGEVRVKIDNNQKS